MGRIGWKAAIPFPASVLRMARKRAPPWWSDLFGQTEYLFRLEATAHRVEAERDEGARANSRESARHQDWPQQLLGEAFDPRGEVHGRADHRKVEPVGGADIAKSDLTEMQADPGSNLGSVGFAARLVDDAETFERVQRSFERPCAGFRKIAVIGRREDRERAVTHEFEGFPLVRLDRCDDRVEIIVEKLDNLLGRQSIGQGREPAHVAHHDDRVQALTHGSPDLTGEHAPSGQRSEIGVEQIVRDPSDRALSNDRGESWIDLFERDYLRPGEPARTVGRPSHHRKAAVYSVES